MAKKKTDIVPLDYLPVSPALTEKAPAVIATITIPPRIAGFFLSFNSSIFPSLYDKQNRFVVYDISLNDFERKVLICILLNP